MGGFYFGQVPTSRFWNLEYFPRPLHKITPRKRTIKIVKTMKEAAVGVEVASTFPGPNSQEPARSAPSPIDDLINTPTPLLYFQILADNFRPVECPKRTVLRNS